MTRANSHNNTTTSTCHATQEIVCATLDPSRLLMVGSEPSVLDADLGRALGMRRPTNIRSRIIEPNILELQGFGPCTPTVHAHPTVPGRTTKSYRLTEPQALLVCMFSRTPTAAAVRKQVIEVFTAWRRQREHQPDTIPVRAHERRTSTPMDKAISLARSADRLESVASRIQPAQASLAWINNLPVPYDADDYRLPAGTPAVVMYQDGRVASEPAEWTGQGRSGLGTAQSMYGAPGARCRSGFTILGRVLGAQEKPKGLSLAKLKIAVSGGVDSPSAQQRRGRRAPFKDAIIRMIGEGKSCREIARTTGASYGTVTHWRRVLEDVQAGVMAA